jgi:hypothetical protein
MNIKGPISSIAIALAGSGGAVSAQGLDQFCLDTVDYLCGGAMVGACFQVDSNWDDLPQECIGDVQTLIEMEREALEQGTAQLDYGTIDGSDGMVPDVVLGLSLGGQLRAGPGQQYSIVATLGEGDYIGVIEYTDVYFQNYPWFYVDSPYGAGYHWGGIICTYEYIEGVYETC